MKSFLLTQKPAQICATIHCRLPFVYKLHTISDALLITLFFSFKYSPTPFKFRRNENAATPVKAISHINVSFFSTKTSFSLLYAI